MNNLITYLSNDSTLPYKWQNLLGSVIGVLGALLVALLGFILNHYYQKYRDLRESIRRTEIALALGLNDIFDSERHLKDFLERLNQVVIQPLQTGVRPNEYFLNKTNFPSLVIHLDAELLRAKHSSYYVHNKILIIHKNIEQVNRAFVEMKTDYEKIIETARFLMVQGATPTNQQREYLSNNQSFATFLNDVIDQLQNAKKIFAQTKIYNLKLLNAERIVVWRMEGISFKFFCCKRDIEEYKSTLRCLDRIDKEINIEVNQSLVEAEERRDGNEKTKNPSTFKECLGRVTRDIKDWLNNTGK